MAGARDEMHALVQELEGRVGRKADMAEVGECRVGAECLLCLEHGYYKALRTGGWRQG